MSLPWESLGKEGEESAKDVGGEVLVREVRGIPGGGDYLSGCISPTGARAAERPLLGGLVGPVKGAEVQVSLCAINRLKSPSLPQLCMKQGRRGWDPCACREWVCMWGTGASGQGFSPHLSQPRTQGAP